MLLLPLLLCVAVCRGYAQDLYNKEYGSTYRIRLSLRTHSLKFIPSGSSRERILWRRDDPSAIKDRRHEVTGNYYVLHRLTQQDSGHYITSNQDQKELSSREISVKEIETDLELSADEPFVASANVEEASCNIYFFSNSDDDATHPTLLARNGQIYSYPSHCAGTVVEWPCGIRNEQASTSCSGRFEFRDRDGNKALVLNTQVESSHFDPTVLLISIGVIGGIITCCCCVRCCCCKKKSSKEDVSDSPDASPDSAPAEPAVQYHSYEYEPAILTTTHINPDPETHHSTPGSGDYVPTGLQIHNPTSVNVNEPPAYSEVSAPAAQADSVTLPLTSDPDPQFELKGMIFPSAPPLSSDSPYCDVYTSDKLNFL